ncbi:MAG: sugar diacid recognition domain-containing protein [Clostridia bacterium]|nr:sugar diacid recognition domain-containing protein [Clostridia bacterium]
MQQNEPVKLSSIIATKIVEAAKETIAYNINIMDDQGVIIASCSPARIGTFHEIASKIINGPDDLIETYDTNNLLGTHPGINTAIKYQNKKVGVLGITGSPDEVRPFMHVLKLAVETMLEFELEQQTYVLQYTQQQHLEAGFLYGSASENNLVKWASELNLDTSVYRIPIMVRAATQLSFSQKMQLADSLTASAHHSAQDFLAQWPRKEFTIFKAIPSDADSIQNYRLIIEEYLTPFIEQLNHLGVGVRICTGSFCNSLGLYHEAYKRAHWLMDSGLGEKRPVVFFYDHIRDWIDSFIPATELRDIYQFFLRDSDDDEFIKRMVSARKALSANNYNFVKASQQLFIHKNTLFSWINDVRKRFNIDPVQNPNDRAFWNYLCRYYEQR